jgi:hypothetical protein
VNEKTRSFYTRRIFCDFNDNFSSNICLCHDCDLDYDFLLKADYYEHYGSVTLKYSF